MKIYNNTPEEIALPYGESRVYVQPRTLVDVLPDSLPTEIPSGLELRNDDGTPYVVEVKKSKKTEPTPEEGK